LAVLLGASLALETNPVLNHLGVHDGLWQVKDAHDRESALRAARPDAVHEHVSQVKLDVACFHLLLRSSLSVSTFMQTRYVWVFGMLVAILIVTRVVEGVVYATLTMKASRRLHDDNFKTVLHGTMAYFDTTPLGRILNRFSGGGCWR
jgi:ABC-type multidrug transport system fused ATPase/permease subunit